MFGPQMMGLWNSADWEAANFTLESSCNEEFLDGPEKYVENKWQQGVFVVFKYK